MANPYLITFRKKLTAGGNTSCHKCEGIIKRGEYYWKTSDSGKRGCGYRYCLSCVGLIASRYSFTDISRLDGEAMEWKKRWDDEIQAKIDILRGIELLA